jgi:hypothetical protein
MTTTMYGSCAVLRGDDFLARVGRLRANPADTDLVEILPRRARAAASAAERSLSASSLACCFASLLVVADDVAHAHLREQDRSDGSISSTAQRSARFAFFGSVTTGSRRCGTPS